MITSPLKMKLNGTLNAAVNGDVSNFDVSLFCNSNVLYNCNLNLNNLRSVYLNILLYIDGMYLHTPAQIMLAIHMTCQLV